uniref:Uncharacterized protein n=2 Tax=Nothobranchius pienaari TaxID=704102 RepID=A0A1A8LY87_9TELE
MAESQVLPLKNIGDAIAGVLPDLPDQLLKSVEDTLKTLGAETTDDLKYITENDLLPVLKPIQARRLVAAWTQNVSGTSTPIAVRSSPVDVLLSPTLNFFFTNIIHHYLITFRNLYTITTKLERFEIPWQRLPEELVQNLERQKRPSARQRREMVRIVVSEMMKICKNPTKHNTTEIAKRMVAKYTKSLQDVIDGEVIGPGYHSLQYQMMATTQTKYQLNKKQGFKTHMAVLAGSQSICHSLRLWRVNLKKKEEMKKLFKKNNYSTDAVKELVTCTYYTQRKEINRGASIQKLCQEWPFLFNEVGMIAHFQELTGVNLMETFLANVDKKGARLLKFLKYVDAQKHKQVLNAVLKLQTERGQSSGCLQEVIEIMLLLLAHFDEKEELLFHCVEMTSLAEDVQMEKVPPTPFIIVCGSSCFAAETFMLSIDKKIVNDRITTFTSAICLMFGSYYCFNIHYPVELRSTLEFLQQCFFSINPERGTKVESKKKKVFSVNPRVLTLISDIADHEWI